VRLPDGFVVAQRLAGGVVRQQREVALWLHAGRLLVCYKKLTLTCHFFTVAV